MTSRSHSGAALGTVPRGSRRIALGIVVWHAGCIILGNTGCFVTWDIPYAEPKNEPPVFVAASLEDGETLVMDDVVPFYAAAIDPDSNGVVLFTWSAGPNHLFDDPFQVGDTGTVEWGSQVEVPYDPTLDGQTLRCTLLDIAGATTTRTWPLEVL